MRCVITTDQRNHQYAKLALRYANPSKCRRSTRYRFVSARSTRKNSTNVAALPSTFVGPALPMTILKTPRGRPLGVIERHRLASATRIPVSHSSSFFWISHILPNSLLHGRWFGQSPIISLFWITYSILNTCRIGQLVIYSIQNRIFQAANYSILFRIPNSFIITAH